MYYNKYLLFSPDDYGGGGGSGDGGSDEGGMDSDIKKSTTVTAKKYIRSLQVQDSETLLNARGDSREIKVIGTPGSGFNLEVNDSSGCSILEEDLNQVEIPKNGVYTLRQSFPDISTSAEGGLVKEYYDITLTPNADARHDTSIDISIDENSTEEEIAKAIEKIRNKPPAPAPDYKIGEPSVTLYQYPDVTITINDSSSQTGPALRVTNASSGSSTITKKGKAGGGGSKTFTGTWIITENSATAGYFYVNNGSFNKSLTTSTMLKKVVSRPEGEFGRTSDIVLKPSTVRVFGENEITSGAFTGVTRGNQDNPISGDITIGMKIYGKIEKTKIVTESLEVPTCRRKTNKFSLSDTVGLFPGMLIRVPGEPLAELISVDCAKNITIDKKIVIRENQEITLKYEIWSSVNGITNQINSKGETCIKISNSIYAVNGMELEFDDNTSQVSGTFRFSGSGSDTVTLKSEIAINKFGLGDVTYTLNLDDFITRTPNAYDYNIIVAKNDKVGVSIKIDDQDYDANASSKTITITGNPNHGAINVSGRTISYLPRANYAGEDEILYTVSDGTNSSEEKQITITVK